MSLDHGHSNRPGSCRTKYSVACTSTGLALARARSLSGFTGFVTGLRVLLRRCRFTQAEAGNLCHLLRDLRALACASH